jgi:hypothetical protein
MAEGLSSATGDLAAARACWWTHKRTLIGLSIDAHVSNAPPGKHVLRFLDQKEIKALFHRVEKDSNNFGRVFVHFRWK